MEKIMIAPQYQLRVKQRLGVVAYAVEHGLKGASRRFGLDRKTVRAWVRRWRAAGVTGLLPRYPTNRPTRLPAEVVRCIEHARRDYAALGQSEAREAVGSQLAASRQRLVRSCPVPDDDVIVRAGLSSRVRGAGRLITRLGTPVLTA
jgi:transposase